MRRARGRPRALLDGVPLGGWGARDPVRTGVAGGLSGGGGGVCRPLMADLMLARELQSLGAESMESAAPARLPLSDAPVPPGGGGGANISPNSLRNWHAKPPLRK